MKVLVTGASGMLGGYVARALRDAGHEVSAFQRRPAGIDGVADITGSLTEEADVRRAVAGQDAVVHLAAKVSISGPEEEYRKINIEGTRHIVEAMKAQGGGKLVNISSPSVAHFGQSIVGLGTTAPEPERASSPYARTKAAAELVAMAADGEDGMLVTSIRPHVVWGPGDTQLVERIGGRAKQGRMPLLDEGNALIDTIYVTNAADAIVAALNRIDEVHGESFVVTNGEPRTVRDIIGGFAAAVGAERPTLRIPSSVARIAGRIIERLWEIRPGYDEPPMTEFFAEQLSTAHWFDQRRTRERLQWTPKVSIDEGFEILRRYYSTRSR
ncbi:NAD-dependent epimerase/dehydratase family protein [Helcobacillus massiliensis]|uniref:Nucleoside-diphosphate-sugar epimerase n=1 Tax=Helcobacillus massiliensis TaxID=521392 RepID=A0A839R1R1_9MICO|nr:NAD-dependent epimerase/dehydratase family protein [Helcobacillus massiliensis]MBB3022546.1 nucleoside-diphosphate-sugar epimerase [Helcobacillus massiliensis]MDK7741249.1 NAD-dependent epimerase/dehydratase family protein [Helcobacillus massiliensis]WOO94053.1 NAD-dependent epimerase/dehydratase family protein [Helcobacillus massiliensis]